MGRAFELGNVMNPMDLIRYHRNLGKFYVKLRRADYTLVELAEAKQIALALGMTEPEFNKVIIDSTARIAK